MEFRYYLAQLDDKDAQLYAFIFDKVRERTSSFVVDAPVDTIHNVIKAIMLDNPEIFWFEGKWKAGTEKKSICVFPKYKTRTNYQEITGNIDNAIADILRRCTLTAVENIQTVYDWLIEHVQYSYSENDQTIEGALLDKKAICKGIAKAFQLAMNRLQIPSYLMEGTIDGQASHIWNVVYVNDHFYHVDVTMGYQRFAGLFREGSRNKHYPCFLVSDRAITATHKIYPGQFPPCTDDFDLDHFLIEQHHIPAIFMRYGSLRYLDKGSTCTVYQVIGENALYALKIVDAQDSNRKYHRGCAELEKMTILSGCQGVAQLEYGFASKRDARVFMLLRYYKPLAARRREGAFDSIKSTLQMGIDILNAMIECRERGIFHLDIQPKNIYFDQAGKAVLGDFGGSAFSEELNTLGRCVGTLAFMAPEVYKNGIYGQASEIYSLGIILYAMLNDAKLPFTEDADVNRAIQLRLSTKELPQPCNCDRAMWSHIRKLCAYDCKERCSTYEEAKTILLELLC